MGQDSLGASLARLAAALEKYHASPDAFRALFEGRPARMLDGTPIPGLEEAVWERAGDEWVWELRAPDGARLARLRPAGACAWRYELA